MSTKPVSLGPWSGVDNVHRPDARVFQPPGEQENRLAALVSAMNVDLDDDGWPVARKPVAEMYDWDALGMEATRVFSALGVFLAYGNMDGAYGIYQIDLGTGTPTLVVGDFSGDGSETVEFFEFEGEIYWTSPLRTGRITVTDGVAALNVWGAESPYLEVFELAENPNSVLPYGQYLFAVTEVFNGIESGASSVMMAYYGTSLFQQYAIDRLINEETPSFTTASSAVELSITSNNDAVGGSFGGYFRVYMSRIGGGQLYYAFSTTQTTIRIPGDPTLSTLPLKTSGMRPPVPGYGVFAYRKTLCTYRGRWIYPDAGVSHHLFNPGSFVIYVPYAVCAAQGVTGGAWVATEHGMYWLSGESRTTMTIIRVDNDAYARGSLLVPASYVPAVRAQGMVALFVNSESVVAGLEDGRLVKLTQNKYKPASVVAKRASIVVDRTGETPKILISMDAVASEVETFAHGKDDVALEAFVGLAAANEIVGARAGFVDIAQGFVRWEDTTSETD